jgi:hypothetical protein
MCSQLASGLQPSWEIVELGGLAFGGGGGRRGGRVKEGGAVGLRSAAQELD